MDVYLEGRRLARLRTIEDVEFAKSRLAVYEMLRICKEAL